MQPIIDAPTTSEVFAYRYLGENYYLPIISWSEKMALSGFESDHLNILLGEQAPFNPFEFDELFAQTQNELGIPSVATEKEAVNILATHLMLRSNPRAKTPIKLLIRLKDLHYQYDSTESLMRFVELSWLLEEQENGAYYGYTPKYSMDDIKQELSSCISSWMSQRPLEKWQDFEWSKSTALVISKRSE